MIKPYLSEFFIDFIGELQYNKYVSRKKGGVHMKFIRMIAVFTAVVLCCVCLSGCGVISADVEKQLIPPKNNAEQEAIQTALYEYLQNDDYLLKYPAGGEYQTPFVLLNQIELPPIVENTNATVLPSSTAWEDMAVVFYRAYDNQNVTQIHLLQRNKNDEWISVANAEGNSEEISEVTFADVNGDGCPELLVGWSLYNSNDKLLAVYRLDRQLEQFPLYVSYTKLLVGDMTNDTAHDLILLTVEDNHVGATASLLCCRDEQLLFRGETWLDNQIRRFGKAAFSALSPTVNGVYVDCYKDANTTITELIYWDGTELHAPFYNAQTGLTTITARETGFESRDVDGDGLIEWPVSRRLPGYEHTPLNKTFWRTDWMAYDFRSGASVRKFSSIVNSADSYIFRLRGDWVTKIRTTYDEERHILSLQLADNEQPFLELLFTVQDAVPEGFTLLEKSNSGKYAYKIIGDTITAQEVQYLFSVI